MSAIELLMSEMHRLADLHVVTLTAYYLAPVDVHVDELDAQSASSYAVRAIAETIATAHAWQHSYEQALRDVMARNTNRRVSEHLEDVLAKLLALSNRATPEACSASLPA